MDLNKTNKCSLCNWQGRTHMHHIIPMSKMGEHSPKNIIELCPNHHAEASEDEERFAKKYNLVGEKYTNKKLESLRRGSFLFMKSAFYDLTELEWIELFEIVQEFKFDKIDFIAFGLGISRKSVQASYVTDTKKEAMMK